MDNGQGRAGCAGITADKVIAAQALAPGTSTQKSEPTALTTALLLSRGNRSTYIQTPGVPSWSSTPVEQCGGSEDVEQAEEALRAGGSECTRRTGVP